MELWEDEFELFLKDKDWELPDLEFSWEDYYLYFGEKARDRRIRDRDRMIARGRSYRLQENWWRSNFKHQREMAEMHGRYHYNHLKICSCDGCCNPRRSGYSSGVYKLTIQERKAGIKPKHKNSWQKELDIQD